MERRQETTIFDIPQARITARGSLLVAATGNIYKGLWYPIAVTVMTTVMGGLLMRDTKDIDIKVGVGRRSIPTNRHSVIAGWRSSSSQLQRPGRATADEDGHYSCAFPI